MNAKQSYQVIEPRLLPPMPSEILDELRRELASRRRLYARLVRSGRMATRTADRRIERIDAAIRFIEADAG